MRHMAAAADAVPLLAAGRGGSRAAGSDLSAGEREEKGAGRRK